MSAFYFYLDLDGTPQDKQRHEAVFASVDHHGIDGKQLYVVDNFAIGVQRFDTLPTKASSEQPFKDPDTGLWCLFHGRLDNRESLLKRLGCKDDAWSDVQLIIELYKKYSEQAFEYIIGPFAVVLFDEKTQTLKMARDAMGMRQLVYYKTSRFVIVSNTVEAIIAYPDVDFTVDQSFLAHKFAFLSCNEPITVAKDVVQVKPGHVLSFENNQLREVLSYLPDPEKRIYYKNPQDYYHHFRELLDCSVRRRLVTSSPIAAMLSGGLDSVPMVISAAQQMTSAEQLHAFTWSFARYPDTDERRYIEGLDRRFGFKHELIECDDVWPSFESISDFHPLQPTSTPYSGFHDAMYPHVKNRGCRVVLSGVGGDILYDGHHTILYEMLRAGQWRSLLNESKVRLDQLRLRNFIKTQLLQPLAIYRKLRKRSIKIPNWLTEEAGGLLKAQSDWLQQYADEALRPIQYRNVVGLIEGNDAALARSLDIRYGFEKRYPFRDRELVEFMLAIPSQYLHSLGRARPIMKEAFRDVLPESLYHREGKANFYPVVERRMDSDEYIDNAIEQGKSWSKFVKQSHIDVGVSDHAYRAILKWMSGYYELWRENWYDKH